MRTTSSRPLLAASLGATVLAGALVAATGELRAEDSVTAEPTKYELSPKFAAGETFRVERRFQQTTITTAASGRGRGTGDFNASSYDASTEIHAVVTIEAVDAKGAATAWTAKFERLRIDVPDPLQTQQYRMRVRERKQKRLPANAHPVEGATLKVEMKGDKARLFKVLKNGEDAGISQRYPEVIPIMQSLVDPDWASTSAIPGGTAGEQHADQIFRMTKVLQKTPLSGKIKCKFASVEEGVANIDWTAELSSTYATAEMKLDAGGRIEFDVAGRRTIGNKYKGEVTISAKGSSLAGRGTISGGASYTDPTAKDDSEATEKDK